MLIKIINKSSGCSFMGLILVGLDPSMGMPDLLKFSETKLLLQQTSNIYWAISAMFVKNYIYNFYFSCSVHMLFVQDSRLAAPEQNLPGSIVHVSLDWHGIVGADQPKKLLLFAIVPVLLMGFFPAFFLCTSTVKII